jgi:hypothetical protein
MRIRKEEVRFNTYWKLSMKWGHVLRTLWHRFSGDSCRLAVTTYGSGKEWILIVGLPVVFPRSSITHLYVNSDETKGHSKWQKGCLQLEWKPGCIRSVYVPVWQHSSWRLLLVAVFTNKAAQIDYLQKHVPMFLIVMITNAFRTKDNFQFSPNL